DYATALYRSHKRDDARRLFAQIAQNPDASTELKAAALYFLAELARDKDDREAQADFIARLRTLAPQSSWLQEALFSAANMYMLKHDYEPAIRFYTEMYQSLPSGRWASYAHWRAAWFSYRLGKRDDARRLLDEQIERYPISGEISAALYWRGRVAEDEDNAPLARACYGKLTEKFHYFYYANLARTRLATLGPGDVAEATMLTKLRGPAPVPQNWDAPSGNLRLQKAQLLANAALSDFAIREMQAAASGSSTWQAGAMAQLYEDAGNYKNALETLKRTVPTYFSAELNQLPRPVWEELFPRPYWADLKKHSADNQLDPYLVASLIRQESEFDPAAVSTANALGLMQLLPSVGRGLAKELKIKQYSQDDLFVAPINIGLGTHYFRHMVDHYNGQVEYALAAYNAGEDRVDDWRRNGSFKDVDEFVESIPFMQTREYVQAIMRNAVLYRLLYPKG
ncbi:MAG TPA: transglycosylase SLT domain-containing protein, partial [Alphaproteobacteria bacterium]|nr:transglycosylase SLT domain-containing protein [Alphaproteobacteria bacterium]